MQLDFITIKRTSNFIISCCVLHNICIMNNDHLDIDLDIVNAEYDERHNEQNPNDRIHGEVKRDIICNLLSICNINEHVCANKNFHRTQKIYSFTYIYINL